MLKSELISYKKKLLYLYNNKKFFEAENLANSIIRYFPRDSFSWKVLGAISATKGLLDKEVLCNEKAVKFDPGDYEALNNLGNTYKKLHMYSDAEKLYKEAIKSNPDFYNAYSNLGLLKRDLGCFDEAISYFKKTIAINNQFAEGHRHLSYTKKYFNEDAHLQQMLRNYNNEDNEVNKCHLGFGIGKAYDDLGLYDQAFKYFKLGNHYKRKLLNYSIEVDIRFFIEVKKSFEKLLKSSANIEIQEAVKPIFILGMPRSGTTLIEQIISSHSKIFGGGELLYASKFGYPIIKSKPDGRAFDKLINVFRSNYLNSVQNLCKNFSMITDKMPQNFFYLGLIALAIPEAKIINLQRDPRAICWSNFTQYFISPAQGFSNSLEDCAAYYMLYDDLMQYWKESLNIKIYNLDYDLLTEDPNNEIKKLLSFLGVNWEENCLSPEKNPKITRTVSNIQTRQKIYKNSSKNWENYSPYIGKSFNALSSIKSHCKRV